LRQACRQRYSENSNNVLTLFREVFDVQFFKEMALEEQRDKSIINKEKNRKYAYSIFSASSLNIPYAD
jgi:hypothetical protein